VNGPEDESADRSKAFSIPVYVIGWSSKDDRPGSSSVADEATSLLEVNNIRLRYEAFDFS
jgi:hypothetical protein